MKISRAFVFILSIVIQPLSATHYTLENSAIQNQIAQGGNTYYGGGGGGLGGGVFVYHEDTLELKNTTFFNCTAQGGSSNDLINFSSGGGGGGFGGSIGGSSLDFRAAGGGGGFGVIVNNLIIPGAGGNSSSSGGSGGGFGGIGADGGNPDGGAGNNYTGPGGAGGTAGSPNGSDGSFYGDGGGGAEDGNGGNGGGGGSLVLGPDGAGNGGFGGGGGDNYNRFFNNAGNGGFGGGGGDNDQGGNNSGKGGFAGGAGGSSTPGFGGGNSNQTGSLGGGGAGLGGALFLHAEAASGSACTIKERIQLDGNAAIGGSGFQPGQGMGQDIFMMSGSQLVVQDLITDSTIPSAIEGNIGEGVPVTPNLLALGGLTLDTGNTARFILTGDNTYTGTTKVNSGILYVNGSVITPVDVYGGGFGGINTLIKIHPSVPDSGNLNMHCGTLFPGGDSLYGQLIVEQNLSLNSSCCAVNLEVDSVSNTDFIQVNGTTQINGATLDIEAFFGSFLEGQVIPIIDSNGGVTGTFETINQPMRPDGSFLFGLQYLPTRVQLVVLQNFLFEDPGQQINKGNPRRVLDYFISILPIDPTSDLGFVVNSLGLLAGKEFIDALNLMHPGVFGALESMNLTNNSAITSMFRNRLSSRSSSSDSAHLTSHLDSLTASTSDRSFYPNAPIRKGCVRNLNTPHSVWIQPFGSWNTQNQKGELRGFNYEATGILAGYDYTFKNFDIGGGIGYTYTNFRWNSSAGDGKIDQVYGGVYGSYFCNYFSADLSSTLGGNFYEIRRNIFYHAVGYPGAQLDRTARSHFKGLQWTNHLGLVGDLSPLSIPLQVFGTVDHFYLNNDSFKESGAKSLNLAVCAKVSNAIRSQLGLNTSYTFQMKNSCWTPYFSISWVNKTPLSRSKYIGAFRGQANTFSVSATSKGINQIAPGLGLEVANKHGLRLLISARGELNAKVKNYFADGRASYTF